MKIGYVRVSTKEQNTARQEELILSAVALCTLFPTLLPLQIS